MNVGTIRQMAMDMCDELNNPSSGKFSVAWWLEAQNYIKDVLAQETGYYVTRHAIPISQYIQTYALPSTLCWGILNATLDGQPLVPRDIIYMDDNNPGWYWEYGFPNQPQNDGIEVLSSSASDTTQTLTLYGTTTGTNTVATETVTLTGTSQKATTKVNWGYMHYFVLSAVCAGDVTIREASGNQTIATISADELTAGNAPGDSTPTDYIISHPSVIFYPVPTEAKTVFFRAGTLPADYTLDADDPSTYGLPNQFHRVQAHGMAAMAQLADIYDQSQEARANANNQAFWGGVKSLLAYLDGMQREREQFIAIGYNPHA